MFDRLVLAALDGLDWLIGRRYRWVVDDPKTRLGHSEWRRFWWSKWGRE